MGFFDALEVSDEIASIGKSAVKLDGFVRMIMDLRDIASKQSISALIEEILLRTDYVAELRAEGTDEAKARIENIDELLSKAVAFEQDHDSDDVTLSMFLEEVALVADIDSYDATDDYVVLMTLHGAKGLEFPRVYMSGMEDGLFPGMGAIYDGGGADSEMEEERRLCYVGITRAMQHLTMTSARQRMVRGETQMSKWSRFVKEIPEELVHGNLWEPKPRDDFSGMISGGEYSVYRGSISGGSHKPKLATTYGSRPTNTSGTKIEKSELDYTVGDRVNHIKFKEGTVLDIIDEGRDYEVTVEFDGVGVKKMFASFAKLKKI